MAPEYKPLREIVHLQQMEIETLKLRVATLEAASLKDFVNLSETVCSLSKLVGAICAERGERAAINGAGIDAALEGRTGTKPEGHRKRR